MEEPNKIIQVGKANPICVICLSCSQPDEDGNEGNTFLDRVDPFLKDCLGLPPFFYDKSRLNPKLQFCHIHAVLVKKFMVLSDKMEKIREELKEDLMSSLIFKLENNCDDGSLFSIVRQVAEAFLIPVQITVEKINPSALMGNKNQHEEEFQGKLETVDEEFEVKTEEIEADLDDFEIKLDIDNMEADFYELEKNNENCKVNIDNDDNDSLGSFSFLMNLDLNDLLIGPLSPPIVEDSVSNNNTDSKGSGASNGLEQTKIFTSKKTATHLQKNRIKNRKEKLNSKSLSTYP